MATSCDVLRVWIVKKEKNKQLSSEQVEAWLKFRHLAMNSGCLEVTLAEDSEKVIAISYWPNQGMLDRVISSKEYKKIGLQVFESWGEGMSPFDSENFNGSIIAEGDRTGGFPGLVRW